MLPEKYFQKYHLKTKMITMDKMVQPKTDMKTKSEKISNSTK
jgi:hypothetical protein